jgi:hypothetical protein
MALPASPLSQSVSKMTVTMQAATKAVLTPMLMKHVELSNERWLQITVDRKRNCAVEF